MRRTTPKTMQRESFDALQGEAEPARSFRARVEQVARSQATVLIRGESGSGKNMVARALHELGSRRGRPLVTVSLAALAPTLVEAELFGHELGAFTGAHTSRAGRFRQADGGTLVLDDIDALPLELQGKLLRVLQERVVEPLGSAGAVPIDVRLLCTTIRDLRASVEAGQFRADLYWRIAVVPLEVPPLRARLGDLPEIAARLIERLSALHGVAARGLSAGALALLRTHSWPGNVRELENALERVLVLAPSGAAGQSPIQAEELAFLAAASCTVAEDLADRALDGGLRLDDLERALLERALQRFRGNLSAAARHIGLTRRAFEYRRAQFRATSAEERKA